MQRTSTSGTVSYTVYAFGLEDHQYSSSGTNTKNTTFLLTDLLGSVLASFSNTSGNAVVQGNQVYSPYGTSKGFTGQYADSTSELNYDNDMGI